MNCHGVGGRDRDHQRLRIGEADVLGGRDHEPAGDEARVLPRLDHARQVVQRGVDVGAADRLDERADHVVVLVALAVVAQQRAVDRLRDVVVRDDRASSSAARSADAAAAAAASSAVSARRASPEASRTSAARAASSSATAPCSPRASATARSIEQPEVVVGERLQREQERAGQQRGDHRERRVLGGRRDEDDPAVLDAGQQRVLLRLREAVDLVEEQDRGLAVQVALVSASSITSRTSLTPAVTAESSTKRRPEERAIA